LPWGSIMSWVRLAVRRLGGFLVLFLVACLFFLASGFIVAHFDLCAYGFGFVGLSFLFCSLSGSRGCGSCRVLPFGPASSFFLLPRPGCVPGWGGVLRLLCWGGGRLEVVPLLSHLMLGIRAG